MISNIIMAGLLASVASTITATAEAGSDVSLAISNTSDQTAYVSVYVGTDRRCKGEAEPFTIKAEETDKVSCASNSSNSCRITVEIADEKHGTCESMQDGSELRCYGSGESFYCSPDNF